MEESNRTLSNVTKASMLMVFVALIFGLALAPIAYAQTLALEKTWGGPNSDYGKAVAIDSSGIYVTGETYSFGQGGDDVVLLKYDLSGSLVWQKTWGGSGNDKGLGVAADTSGIYVTGYTTSFGGGSKNIVLKFDHSGNLVWQRTYGTSQFDEGRGIAVYSSDIYVTGHTYNSSLDVDLIVLLKFGSSGNLVWQKTWGGSANTNWGEAVAVDSSGIYVTGETAAFGQGSNDVVLLKYDSSGNLLWQKTWGGSGDDRGYGVAVDASGIYVTGYTTSFGQGSYDVVLLKYDSSGNLLWQKTWGGANWDIGNGVAVDSSGIYVTGYTTSFGQGSYDVVLLKYDSSGNLLWQKTWGGSGDDEGYGIVVGSSVIYVTGLTSSASRTLWYVSGTTSTPSGTTGTPLGNVGTPRIAADTPSGVNATSTGSETYAGASDVFLLLFTPAPPGTLTVTVFVKDSATGGGIAGATIIFDGVTQPGTSNVMGMLTVTGVGPGTHAATASMAGYSASPVTFYVTRSTSVTVPLTSTVGTRTVTVQVQNVHAPHIGIPNAIVYVDGAYAGTTDGTGQLSLPGVRAVTHSFTVVCSGYITNTKTSSSTTVTIYLTPR